MPLAEDTRAIASEPEDISQRRRVRSQIGHPATGIPDTNPCGVASCEECRASRGTEWRNVELGQSNTGMVEFIQVGCVDLTIGITAQVAESMIIGKQQDNVGAEIECILFGS